MDLQLKGKTAFISGSTQGIGFAIAQQLLREGAEVTINGRTIAKTNKAKEVLKKEFPQATINAIVLDFSKKEDVTNMLNTFGNFDLLINNVGIFGINDFENTTDEDWYTYFEINVMSAVRLSRKLLPQMLANNFGRILFISSESGVNIPENMIAYGMTKAAMTAISNGLSKLTKGTAVTVNTILGGPTYSDGVATTIKQIATAQQIPVQDLQQAIIQQTNPHILLQRFIQPAEIANLATYLCSPVAIATNGASVRADSGVLRVV